MKQKTKAVTQRGCYRLWMGGSRSGENDDPSPIILLENSQSMCTRRNGVRMLYGPDLPSARVSLDDVGLGQHGWDAPRFWHKAHHSMIQ